MISVALAVAIVTAVVPRPDARDPADAWRIVKAAQHAVETGMEGKFEREWTLAATRQPDDRRAWIALGALAQLRYQYERADSMYERVIRIDPRGSEYTAAAHVSMALWRAIGSDAARADSLFMQAKAEDLTAGDWHIAFQALVNVGKLRSRRAGPKAGLELAHEAAAIAKDPTPDERAQLLCTEGLFMEQLADTTGRARLADGIRIARQSNALRELGICDVALATVVERSGSFYEAERAASEAVSIFEKIHFPHGAASASQWLGHARLTRGFFARAHSDLERAVRDARLARFTQTEAWARTGLADLYFALGDAESARAEAERAAAIHSSYGDLWGFAIDLQFQGSVAEMRGAFDEASGKYAQSVAAFGRAGLAFDAVGSLRLLAIAQMRAGHLDSAQRALDEGTRLARTSANSGWQVELPVYLARLAMLRGDLQAADSLLVVARPNFLWRNMVSGDLATMPFAILEAQLALREHRVAVADTAVAYLSSAIARRRRGMSSDDLRAGLAQLRGDWGGLSDAYPELIAGLIAGGRLPSAFRFIESVRAREIADATLRTIGRMSDSSVALAGYRRMSASAPVLEIDDARRRLSSDEALVVFTLGDAGAPTTAIVVTSDTAFSVSTSGRAVVAPLIERYTRVAASGVDPVAVSRQLGAALLQPVVRTLPARITRLSISPDGDLYRVPFDALRLADDRFAVERFAISIVPSATVALALRGAGAPAAATRLIAIGDPAFAREKNERHVELRTDAAADSATPFHQVALARLPRSADEATRVGRYGMTSLVLTRAGASEAAVRAVDWRDVAVAHFATHALIDGEGQARTALALAPNRGDDGFLTSAEVAALRFNGALVVLSACETLGGQILGGEGLRGLVGPLFEAGARAVVVTHWSIGDRTVLPFIDRFYANMAAGQSVGDALRQTKLAAIRDGARISDWAAFTVIGDASMHPPLRRANLPPLAWLREATQATRDTSGATGSR